MFVLKEHKCIPRPNGFDKPANEYVKCPQSSDPKNSGAKLISVSMRHDRYASSADESQRTI